MLEIGKPRVLGMIQSAKGSTFLNDWVLPETFQKCSKKEWKLSETNVMLDLQSKLISTKMKKNLPI